MKHQLAEVRLQHAEVKHQHAEVKHQHAEVKHQLAEVRLQLAEVKHQLAEVRLQLAEVKHQLAEVYYKVNALKRLKRKKYSLGVWTTSEIAGGYRARKMLNSIPPGAKTGNSRTKNVKYPLPGWTAGRKVRNIIG